MKILKTKYAKTHHFSCDCPMNILLLAENTYHLALYNFLTCGIRSCARCVDCIMQHGARSLVNWFILRLAAPKSLFKALQRSKKVQEARKDSLMKLRRALMMLFFSLTSYGESTHHYNIFHSKGTFPPLAITIF